jgi:hypothetical protein
VPPQGEWPPVPLLWPGETVVLIAGGPSVTQAQVDYVRGKARVIVVNNAYQLAPWADLLYACDGKWWDVYQPDFAGLKVTQDAGAQEKHGILRVPLAPYPACNSGLSLDPLIIHSGTNGGYQALNLSIHLAGPGKRILLGYDMKRAAKGKRHHHADHPIGMNNPDDYNFDTWREKFATTLPYLRRAQVQVLNCSADSALECFPKAELESVL